MPGLTNHVALFGRVADAPLLRQTTTGRSVLTFTIKMPSSSRSESGDWVSGAFTIPARSLGDMAEQLSNRVETGNQVFVTGRLESGRSGLCVLVATCQTKPEE